MASTQDLGKVRLVAKGAYNSATNYEADDWVTYEGSSYYCKQNSTGHAPTDTTYWGILASKGDAGASPDITMSATSDGTSSDNPTVSVTKGGTTSNPTYALAFSGLKGGKGDTGDTGDSLTASSVHANDKTTVTIKNARTEATVNTFDVPDGEDGKGINNITKTSTSGLVDTYTITYTDGTTSTFTVTNGQDGQGSGDMTKAVYDSDNDVADAGGIKAYVSSHGGAVQSVNNKTGVVVLTASDVGAGSATDVTNNANAISAIKDGQSIDSFGDVESALEGKFPRSEQAVLGAKNFLYIPDKAPYTWNTMTVSMSNGVVSINGTSPNEEKYLGLQKVDATNFKGKELIISVDEVLDTTKFGIYVNKALNGAFVATLSAIENGKKERKFIVPDSNDYNQLDIGVDIKPNTVMDNLIKPMLRLATDTDDTYAPYAKTNRELTEDVANIPTVSVTHTGTASSTGVRKQQITVNNVSYDVDGSAYMEQSVTLSTSQATDVVFTNAIIADGTELTFSSSIWDLVPDDMVTTTGVCTVTLPKWTSAVTIGCRLRVR